MLKNLKNIFTNNHNDNFQKHVKYQLNFLNSWNILEIFLECGISFKPRNLLRNHEKFRKSPNYTRLIKNKIKFLVKIGIGVQLFPSCPIFWCPIVWTPSVAIIPTFGINNIFFFSSGLFPDIWGLWTTKMHPIISDKYVI